MAKQRVAVVTGGMGGLGETISTKMADAGYRVVVTYSPSNTKYRSWLEEMKSRDYSFAAFPVYGVLILALLACLLRLDPVAAWALVPYLVYLVYASGWGFGVLFIYSRLAGE